MSNRDENAPMPVEDGIRLNKLWTKIKDDFTSGDGDLDKMISTRRSRQGDPDQFCMELAISSQAAAGRDMRGARRKR